MTLFGRYGAYPNVGLSRLRAWLIDCLLILLSTDGYRLAHGRTATFQLRWFVSPGR